jgi:hypothetical protein
MQSALSVPCQLATTKGEKMRRSSHQALNRQRLANVAFPILSILLLVSSPTVVTAQKIPEVSKFEKKKEKITQATFQITNQCPEPHRFRVTSNIKDPGFTQQTDAILIGANSSEKINVLFDAIGSKSNPKAVAECLDCKKEEGCNQKAVPLQIQMTALEPVLSKGEIPSVSTRFSSGLFPQGANDVGIIPDSSGVCPVGSEHICISMDDEDNHKFGSQNNSSVQGWTGDISRYSTGTTFGFCRVDGSQFHSFQNSYAVLQLGSSCPAGSLSFLRLFNNEDNKNHNWESGSLGPNTVYFDQALSGVFDTKMYFCFFNADPVSGQPLPNLHVPYGVFAAPSSSWLATGTVHTDDEDDNNSQVKDATTPSGTVDAVNFAKIIYGTDDLWGGRNTNLLVAKVANNTDCINPCPYMGSYDKANCWVGQPPPGTNAIIVETLPGFRVLRWTPLNNCPIWYDGAYCAARATPGATRPFIWSNMWYVEPVCRP